MSSLCDLWLSQSVGVKWLGTWQIPLSNYSKSLKRYSKGMNLLFINSQLYIDLLCTPFCSCPCMDNKYSPRGSQSNKSKWKHVTFLLILNGFLSCFKYAQLVPTSRFSCWLFALPGVLFPRCLQAWLPHLFGSQLKSSLWLSFSSTGHSLSRSLFISLHSTDAGWNDMRLFILPLFICFPY